MSDDEKRLLDILMSIERSVNAQDYEALRPLIPDDSEMFGSFEPVMRGFEDMAEQQFRRVWPRIGAFSIDKATIRIRCDAGLGYASNFFTTEGTAADGSPLRRRGRMTWVFQKRAGKWQIVHSHDSLAPERTLQSGS